MGIGSRIAQNGRRQLVRGVGGREHIGQCCRPTEKRFARFISIIQRPSLTLEIFSSAEPRISRPWISWSNGLSVSLTNTAVLVPATRPTRDPPAPWPGFGLIFQGVPCRSNFLGLWRSNRLSDRQFPNLTKSILATGTLDTLTGISNRENVIVAPPMEVGT